MSISRLSATAKRAGTWTLMMAWTPCQWDRGQKREQQAAQVSSARSTWPEARPRVKASVPVGHGGCDILVVVPELACTTLLLTRPEWTAEHESRAAGGKPWQASAVVSPRRGNKGPPKDKGAHQPFREARPAAARPESLPVAAAASAFHANPSSACRVHDSVFCAGDDAQLLVDFGRPAGSGPQSPGGRPSRRGSAPGGSPQVLSPRMGQVPGGSHREAAGISAISLPSVPRASTWLCCLSLFTPAQVVINQLSPLVRQSQHASPCATSLGRRRCWMSWIAALKSSTTGP